MFVCRRSTQQAVGKTPFKHHIQHYSRSLSLFLSHSHHSDISYNCSTNGLTRQVRKTATCAKYKRADSKSVWTYITACGICSMHAFGPNVVTGLGPCRDWVLLKGRGEHTVRVAGESSNTHREH